MGFGNSQVDGHAGRVHRTLSRIGWLSISGSQQAGYRHFFTTGIVVLAAKTIKEQLGSGSGIGIGDVMKFQVAVRTHSD